MFYMKQNDCDHSAARVVVYQLKTISEQNNECVWLLSSHCIHRPHPSNVCIFAMSQDAHLQLCSLTVDTHREVRVDQQVPLPCLPLFSDHKLCGAQYTIQRAASQ